LLQLYRCIDRINTQMNLNLRLYRFKIRNVVGSIGLGYKLDIEKMHMDFFMESSYDKDTFTGMHKTHYLYDEHGQAILDNNGKPRSITVMLFYTGKVVFTGARNEREIEQCIRDIDFEKYKIK